MHKTVEILAHGPDHIKLPCELRRRISRERPVNQRRRATTLVFCGAPKRNTTDFRNSLFAIIPLHLKRDGRPEEERDRAAVPERVQNRLVRILLPNYHCTSRIVSVRTSLSFSDLASIRQIFSFCLFQH